MKVLLLDKGYQPCMVCDARPIIINLFARRVRPLRIYHNEDGSLSDPEDCYTLEDWMKLQPLEGEMVMGTPTIPFIVPHVAVCNFYVHKVHERRTPLRPTKKNIWERDGYICAYTGKKLSKSERTIDHVIPKDQGGQNTWENMVTCDRDLNHKKANRTPEEAGLELLIDPKPPKGVSLLKHFQIHKDVKPEWEYFLPKKPK